MIKFEKKWLKFLIAFLLFALAIIRLFLFNEIGDRMDHVFIILVVLGALIPFIPWERLTSLKAGTSGIEMTLDRPEVKGALKAFIPEVEGAVMGHKEEKEVMETFSEQLRSRLRGLSKELEQFRGSRILWIDDKPHKVMGERRIFRALGAEIVSTTSSKMAEEQINRDNDFDAIITDVQRPGKSRIINNAKFAIDGVDFIVNLKKKRDPLIRSIPIVFYSGWKDWKTLVMLTQPARDISPEIEICNTIDMLISKTIPLVAKNRANPISVPTEKIPTQV